jgi:hypothetical protein
MTQLCESCLPAASPTLRVGLAGPVQGAWPRTSEAHFRRTSGSLPVHVAVAMDSGLLFLLVSTVQSVQGT